MDLERRIHTTQSGSTSASLRWGAMSEVSTGVTMSAQDCRYRACLELSAERIERSSDSTTWHASTAASQPAGSGVAFEEEKRQQQCQTLCQTTNLEEERVVLTVWLCTRWMAMVNRSTKPAVPQRFHRDPCRTVWSAVGRMATGSKASN